MKNMREEKSRHINRFYLKVMFVFLLTIVSMIAVMLIISYDTVNKKVSEEYQKFIWDSAYSVDQNFSQCMKDSEEACISIYNSVEGICFRLENDRNVIWGGFYHEIMDKFKSLTYVQAIHLFSADDQQMNFYNSAIPKYRSQSSDQTFKELLHDSPGQICPILWTAQNRYAGREDLTFLSVYYRAAHPSTEYYKGTIVANLDTAALSARLFSKMENRNVVYYIVNQKGEVVASSNLEYCGEDWYEKEWIRTVLESEKISQTQWINGTAFEMYSMPSSTSNFFIVIQSLYQDRVAQVRETVFPMITSMGVIILCCATILNLVLLRIFSPLNIIFNSVRLSLDKQGEKVEGDDIKMLGRYHDGLLDHVEILREKENKNQIIQILLQNQNVEELLIENEYVYRDLEYRLLVVCFGPQKGQVIRLEEIDKIRNVFETLCQERLSPLGRCSCFEIGFRRLLVLVSHNGQKQSSWKDVHREAETLLCQVSAEYNLFLTAYWSEGIIGGDAARNCTFVYRKADSCLKTMNFLESQIQMNLREEQPDYEIWKKELEKAKQCAILRDWDVFERNINSLFSSLKNQRWEVCRQAFVQLAISIHNAHGKKDNGEQFAQYVLQEIDSVDNCEELLAWMKTLFDNDSGWVSKKDSPAAMPIIERAVNCINNRYQEKDLNLNNLAQDMHISPAYLGKLFRTFTGSSFNEYLMRIRIEHARDMLLLKRDSSVADIGDAVGYASTSYFTVVFKKYYGVSPSAYRNMQDELQNKQKEEMM